MYYSIPVTQPRPFWSQMLYWVYYIRVSVCLEATKACLGMGVLHAKASGQKVEENKLAMA